MVFRLILVVVLILALGLGGVWLFGPREPADLTVTFDPAIIGPDPAAYLARTEADVPNLRPGDEKQIIWAYPASRAKTPLAIVVIHGFSASKEELRPLPDDVAAKLGANLFFTRLSGHGSDGVSLARATVNDWVNDLAEAMAIGRQIGERVIIISLSTGGTLSTLGTTIPGIMDKTAGLVLMSPNFVLKDRYAFVLDLPYARAFGPRLFGAERGYDPQTPEQAAHWTTHYPTIALMPMGALLRATRKVDPATIKIPAFFIYSPNDQTVDPAGTEAVAAAWGGPKSVLQVPISGDPSNHILAGRIVSPGTTAELTERIVDWIKARPPQ